MHRTIPTAFVYHPQHYEYILRGLVKPLAIPPESIPVAQSQGWIVLASDADVYPADVIVNIQSASQRARRFDHVDGVSDPTDEA